MIRKLSTALCAIGVCFLWFDTVTAPLGSGHFLSQAMKYFIESAKDIPWDLTHTPKNEKGSIEYHVYTPENPKKPCYLEPTKESLEKCKINPKYKLILLVHGFITLLNPGNLFELMKDALLDNGNFTVIILDWTRFCSAPYTMAVKNLTPVSNLGAEMLNYLTKNAGVKASKMIIAGHSLGSHMAGYIGRQVPNLSRIDGLDPAWPYFSIPAILSKLSTTDAKYVRAIHTSSGPVGFGTNMPLGHIDFYVNDGKIQPPCKYGKIYTRTNGEVVNVTTWLMKHICYHEMVNLYYIATINSTKCHFLATHCDNYEVFENGTCNSKNSKTVDMGFFAKKVTGFKPKSKFYLATKDKPPYCKNG